MTKVIEIKPSNALKSNYKKLTITGSKEYIKQIIKALQVTNEIKLEDGTELGSRMLPTHKITNDLKRKRGEK